LLLQDEWFQCFVVLSQEFVYVFRYFHWRTLSIVHVAFPVFHVFL
jgi:hypothetical protein